MPFAWRFDEGQGWTLFPLSADGLADHDLFAPAGLRFVRVDSSGQHGTALLCPERTEIHLNGEIVLGGLTIISHRDEMCVDGQRFVFLDEDRPQVSEFLLAEGQRRPKCPVCRQPINDRDQFVACPRCRTAFHQVDSAGERPEKHCFTYRPACPRCEHATSLSGEISWTPSLDD